MDKKLNKVEAGFHMLQLLSAVDGKFSLKEDLVIRKYLLEKYPFYVNMDATMEILSALPKKEYILHFQKCMDDYYEDSTAEERADFLNYAVQLVKADESISKFENIFLKTLFDTWEIDSAG